MMLSYKFLDQFVVNISFVNREQNFTGQLTKVVFSKFGCDFLTLQCHKFESIASSSKLPKIL